MGDVEVKEKLAAAINAFLDPIRERRSEIEARSGYVDEVLYDGTLHMREVARQTLIEMKKAMGVTGIWNRISRKAEKVKKAAGGGSEAKA